MTTPLAHCSDSAKAHPLAHMTGIRLVVDMLVHQGAMCSKCGYGTRVTSKKYAKCKKCGQRVERRSI